MSEELLEKIGKRKRELQYELEALKELEMRIILHMDEARKLLRPKPKPVFGLPEVRDLLDEFDDCR